MNKERLLKLADYLETVPPEKFDMGTWITGEEIPGKSDEGNLLECGSAGCALGWATMVPEFREAGLFFHRTSIVFCEHDSFRAAEAFFGLDSHDSQLIFSSLEYPGGRSEPSEVSARIRDLVAVRSREDGIL